ncbi:hypothetical protein M0R36_07185 [bacterium]|jgi:hypothetical protein|nr:hypothetical protein [bacterium]
MNEEILASGMGLMIYSMIILLLGMAALVVIIWWRIVSKTGYPGVLSLLMFVPVANIVLIVILAFTEWPIERENRSLKTKR